MPYLVKVVSDDAVDKYVPPEGYAVLFLSQSEDGSLSIRAKLEDGSVIDVVNKTNSETVEIVQDTGVVLLESIPVEDIDTGVWTVDTVSSDDGIIVV